MTTLYIREDGSHVTSEDVGAYDHHIAAHKELRRRGWKHGVEALAFARTETFRDLYEVLRRGYVRVGYECGFEVWRLDELPRVARAEMELLYLRGGCVEVTVDEVAPPARVRTLRPERPRLGALARAFN